MELKMNDIYLDNINLNEREFREKKTVLESKPTRILVTLTNKCNFKCTMWISNADLPEDEL